MDVACDFNRKGFATMDAVMQVLGVCIGCNMQFPYTAAAASQSEPGSAAALQ